MALTQESVLAVLRTVEDPDLKKDLVTLGMIRDLKVTQAGEVSLCVMLTTPACPLKAKIEAEVKSKLLALTGVKSVEVKMDAEVKNRKTETQANLIAGVQHIIAVSSGKGGVGKSTVSVNLATALALEGARVGLMDADIYGPNTPTMMGVIDGPKIEQHPEKGDLFIPPLARGVKVMSMGFLVEGDQPLVWRGPMLHNILQQFCHKVNWGDLDYLVVDMPPGTGDVQLSLAQLVPISGTVLVTTPQEVAMQDVRKAFHMWEKVRIPLLGIVENMSYFQDNSGKRHAIFGTGGGQMLAKKYGTTLLAEIPIVTAIREGGDEGTPIVVREPSSEAALKFRALARTVAQQVSILASGATGPSAGIQIGTFS